MSSLSGCEVRESVSDLLGNRTVIGRQASSKPDSSWQLSVDHHGNATFHGQNVRKILEAWMTLHDLLFKAFIVNP
jgi:hypothetical protein